MSTLARPTGPLPPAVYWRRRILALAVALLLVLGIGRVLSWGSDGQEGAQGTTVSGKPTGDPTVGASTEPDTPDRTRTRTAKPTKTKTPLVEPDGPCQPSDVLIEPAVTQVHAQDVIPLKLSVGTRTSPACIFAFDSRHVTLKISSGKDLIWTSVECPRQVPSRELVLRSTERVKVTFEWSGRRSDEGCTSTTDWALPGYYHLSSSALGGEPADDQFELRPPKTVTETAKPEKDKHGDKKSKRD